MTEQNGKAAGVRTDLALEERERLPGSGGEIAGVSLREWTPADSDLRITEVKVLDERGARIMGKEKGTYLTIEAKGIGRKAGPYNRKVAEELSRQILRLTGQPEGQGNKLGKIFVAGLGNLYVTPDSLGPRVLQRLPMTRHYDNQYGQGYLKKRQLPALSGIAPGVMAQTGMETAEILKGIVKETRPDLVIAIDALAARSVHRLGCTIQLTDTGIRPGSGVGNHRQGLTFESLGVKVLAIGVPTVVGAAAIVQDTVGALAKALEAGERTKGTGSYLESLGPDQQYQLIRELIEPEFGAMFVTPPDIEERVEVLGKVISRGIRLAFLG
ncbi:MAG TPA: GPR endopeptidase [Candidatus Cottocaccamicrobium excrementipullorum]|nr:GPR endopeptidase [Candidatus Cottocaccamicrobium excrementipullorum]